MIKYTHAFCSVSVDDLEKAREFYSRLGLNVTDNPMGLLELHIESMSNVLVYPKQDHIAATFTVSTSK